MDSGKPKRPPSAYMMWLNSNRESLKAKHPKLKGNEFSKKCGEIWKSMDQSVWQEKAAKAKLQYEEDMEAFEISDQEEKQDRNLSSVKEESELNESDESDNESSDEPDPKKLKRTDSPKSAYNLWLKSARASIEVEHPGLKLSEIAKKAGQIWKAMSTEQKNIWKEKAAKKKQSEKENFTISFSDEEATEEETAPIKIEDDMTFEEMSVEDLLEFPNMAAVACSYNAKGRLHPQETGFVFVPEPQSSLQISFEDITNVKFAKTPSSSTLSFDIEIALNSGDVRKFGNISKSECDKLREFMSSKDLQIKNEKDEKDGRRGIDLLEFEGSDTEERDVEGDDAAEKEDIRSNPMYGFMTFLRISRDSIVAENPDLKDGEIFRKAGEMWRAMTKAEKDTWFEKAAKAKAQFLKDLDAYYSADLEA